jgi:putative hydrolases of HD superfamily
MTAPHPAQSRPSDSNPLAERVTQCLAELHLLSKLPRVGWVMAGVEAPETVAIHCYETALIAAILCRHVDEPVDVGKVLTMAIFHETGEARTTDLPRRSSPYLKHAKGPAEHAVAEDVLRGVAEDVLATLDEFHEGQTLEARITEAAEELQIIFAALMYAKENNGDMTEYRNDVAKYDGEGIRLAEDVAAVVRRRLNEYLGERPYWEIGYDRAED